MINESTSINSTPKKLPGKATEPQIREDEPPIELPQPTDPVPSGTPEEVPHRQPPELPPKQTPDEVDPPKRVPNVEPEKSVNKQS